MQGTPEALASGCMQMQGVSQALASGCMQMQGTPQALASGGVQVQGSARRPPLKSAPTKSATKNIFFAWLHPSEDLKGASECSSRDLGAAAAARRAHAKLKTGAWTWSAHAATTAGDCVELGSTTQRTQVTAVFFHL